MRNKGSGLRRCYLIFESEIRGSERRRKLSLSFALSHDKARVSNEEKKEQLLFIPQNYKIRALFPLVPPPPPVCHNRDDNVYLARNLKFFRD